MALRLVQLCERDGTRLVAASKHDGSARRARESGRGDFRWPLNTCASSRLAGLPTTGPWHYNLSLVITSVSFGP